MAMSEYSLSDIATASRENGFGGDTAWCMIILFAMIFGWGGNGFGFGNRGPAGEPVTEAGRDRASKRQRDLQSRLSDA